MTHPSHPHTPHDPPGYIDTSLRSFLLKLADRTPEPAGGAALALAAASAAALVGLSCPPRAPDSGAHTELSATCSRRSEELRRRIQELVDEDIQAYREVMRSLSLPQDTKDEQAERRSRIDSALIRATDIPIQVAQSALEVIELAMQVGDEVPGPAVGDLAAAIHLAEAAARGSLRNARINAGSISSSAEAATLSPRIDELQRKLESAVSSSGAMLRNRGLE